MVKLTQENFDKFNSSVMSDNQSQGDLEMDFEHNQS